MAGSSRLTDALRRLPGIGSYRGRYLYFALAVLLAFATAGTVGYVQVSGVSQQHLGNIQQRAQATAALHDSLALLREVQSRIGRYLINPPQDTSASIRAAHQRLHSAVRQLASAQWIRNTPEMLLLTESVDQGLGELDLLIEQLIELRSSHNRWLPATVEIESGIHPATVAGQGMLEEMREELLSADPSAEAKAQLAIVNTMRHRWVQALSEVRLMLINRFGVFAEHSEQGMAARERNVRTYLEAFRTQLSELEALNAEGRLGLIASTRLTDLEQVADRWEQAVSVAVMQLTGRDWRPDMSLVRDRVEPLIETLQQRLSSLRLELDVESARNITELTDVSRDLTEFAGLLIAAGALFAFAAYLMFDRMLLRPIQQTTLALKQEARGEGQLPDSAGKAQEIRDLVTAFEAMRRQVRQRQDHLDHLAHHDTLSGLPNRLLFRDRLEHALAFARRDGSLHAVMILDLDGFKKINDTLGHAAGDELLCTAADRLTDTVRQSDTVARLGGDEFAILIERLEHRNDLTRLAEKILAALEVPFEVEGRRLHLSTSIGIAVAPLDGVDPDSLTRAADTAMYAAKQAGKACFRFFTAEMSEQANSYMELETALRGAVDTQAFELHFQPIITAGNGQLHGCEALLRWSHPERGPVSPAAFVPVLEDMGKLGQVSRWILGQLGEQQRRCRYGDQPLTVSVNLTARLLCDPTFSNFLLATLREHVAVASNLIVEITEDSLSEDLDGAARVMRELKMLGVRIALDDFGTGQSSLAHLRHFPFDLVKIDREFVRDIPHDPNDVSLVQAIIELSHAFDMQVVAEGVETEEQASLLKQLGCDYLQGYLISRPMPGEDLRAFLTDHPTISPQAASGHA